MKISNLLLQVVLFTTFITFSSFYTRNVDPESKNVKSKVFCGPYITVYNFSSSATANYVKFTVGGQTFTVNNIGPGSSVDYGNISAGSIFTSVSLSNSNSNQTGSIKIYEVTTSGSTILECEDTLGSQSYYPFSNYFGNCAVEIRVIISDYGC